MSRARRHAYHWLPALIVFVASIVFWELLVRAFDIQNFLLPAPSDNVATLREDWGEL
jgi:NitT/TauT family transport system permease protein